MSSNVLFSIHVIEHRLYLADVMRAIQVIDLIGLIDLN